MILEIKQEYYVFGEYPKKERVECFREDLKLLGIYDTFHKAFSKYKKFDEEGYDGLFIAKGTHNWR